MLKLRYLHFSAAVPAFAAQIGVEARGAQLEGALPPVSSSIQAGRIRHRYSAGNVGQPSGRVIPRR
jgi:hypothetical protein